MKTIMKIQFGSHLYGTETPDSDFDFKSVFLPTARQILLQRAQKVVTTQVDKAVGEKNKPGDVEEEGFSLQRYLQLISDGQTVALDMLFAPASSHLIKPDPIWNAIQKNKERLLTRKAGAFVGYCRAQANKYGIKGSRVAAARKALQILDEALSTNAILPHDKLEKVIAPLEREIELAPFMSIMPIQNSAGDTIKHWEVCNRKMPYTSSVKNARDLMNSLVSEYGFRALQAENNEGVDWKALSHAVRVGLQAIDLFKHGEIVFPLPYAEHLLEIKTGKLDYKDVSAEIDELLPAVEAAAAGSSLPEEPDMEWIDDFVAHKYRNVVTGDMDLSE